MLINRGIGVYVDKRNESNTCLGERSLVGKCGGESLDLRAWRDCYISSQIIVSLPDVNARRKVLPCIPSPLIKRAVSRSFFYPLLRLNHL